MRLEPDLRFSTFVTCALTPMNPNIYQSCVGLQTVFEHIGSALGILITLDYIFTMGTTFQEHWKQYKR